MAFYGQIFRLGKPIGYPATTTFNPNLIIKYSAIIVDTTPIIIPETRRLCRQRKGCGMRIDVDKEFDSIVLRDIKLDISKAFILLEANMMEFLPLKNNDEKQSLLVGEKANQMKNEINHFIDVQVKMIAERKK